MPLRPVEAYHSIQDTMTRSSVSPLVDRYRCSPSVERFTIGRGLRSKKDFFRLGEDTICHGRWVEREGKSPAHGSLPDMLDHVVVRDSDVWLPFDPTEIIDDLRAERYRDTHHRAGFVKGLLYRGYYLLRPLFPITVRRHLQRFYLRGWDRIPFPAWPVDVTVERVHEKLLMLAIERLGVNRIPFIWFWPDGLPSCSIMTHDVETQAGVDFCHEVMDLNDRFGIKASFQVVPEGRYRVQDEFLDSIRDRGFELNVHDLNHDGHLFRDRDEFLRRADGINKYLHNWGAQGFRSAVMYRNLEWHKALNISYDLSIPNVAHLDPQSGGCCTVFPFFNGDILEIPTTATQDYSMFHILGEFSIELWKKQCSLIRDKNGVISFITHPDYLQESKAKQVYCTLLEYLQGLRESGETWVALPHEVAAWWRQRSQMELANTDGVWKVKGPGSERARVAYCEICDGKIRYTLDEGA